MVDDNKLRDLLRARVAAEGNNMAAVGRAFGVDRWYISLLLRGERPITEAIGGHLGYEKEPTRWKKKKSSPTK
jgi:hypothetical protein